MRGEVARGLHLLHAQFAEAEDGIDHLLGELGHLVHALDRFLLVGVQLRRDRSAGRRTRLALAGEQARGERRGGFGRTEHQLTTRRPAPAVIALSSHTTEKWLLQAIRAGARGYVVKTDTAENLRRAILTVARGGTWFSEQLATILGRLSVEPRLAQRDPLSRLSHRQRVVLQLIAEGCTNKEIAARLKISERTVDCHRTELMRRLDMHEIASLVRFAVQEGVIHLD
mgnify:CR=1 FL=1